MPESKLHSQLIIIKKIFNNGDIFNTLEQSLPTFPALQISGVDRREDTCTHTCAHPPLLWPSSEHPEAQYWAKVQGLGTSALQKAIRVNLISEGYSTR